MAPATFDTVNKWAAGISDTLALGILCEAYGMGIPTAVIPYVSSAQAALACVILPREHGARYLQAAPEDGMHALRHAHASVLLDAGESIKARSPSTSATRTRASRFGRTRTYTHLLPSSEAHTRKAIDDAFTEAEVEHRETGVPGTQGTPVPSSEKQCALTARRLFTGTEKGEARRPRPIRKKPQLRAKPSNKADAPPHGADG